MYLCLEDKSAFLLNCKYCISAWNGQAILWAIISDINIDQTRFKHQKLKIIKPALHSDVHILNLWHIQIRYVQGTFSPDNAT